MKIWSYIKNNLLNSGWKKIVFSLFIVTPFVAVPIVSVVNSSIRSEVGNNELYYRYNDTFFNDKNEILDYARSASSQSSEVVGVENTYYLDDKQNSSSMKFDDSIEYQNYLSRYIQPMNTTTSLMIDDVEARLEPIDKSLPLDLLKHFNFNELNNSIEIYRGYNDQIFTNEDDAKNSYYRIYDGFQYNDIYFCSKEELKYYLKTVFYDKLDNIPVINDKHVLKVYGEHNDKITSSPINLTNQNNQTKLKNFANDTLQSSLTYTYRDKNDQEQNFRIDSEKDINTILKDPQVKQSLLTDLDYFKVYQTNGKAGFVVDTLSEDKADFIGQNYVETSQDINGIADYNNWQSYNETNYTNFNSTINKSISNMLNYFVLEVPYSTFEESNSINTKAHWFNYTELSEDDNSINAKFKARMMSLGQGAINLFNDVLYSAIKMEKLKHFNNFLKIPTLYTIAMNLIFNRELSHEITKTVQNYFINVAYYLDQKIMNLVPSSILESANKNSFFSYINFFNLNNNDFNFNQNIGNIYLDKIKTDFPYLAIFALFQNAPKTNQQTTLGLWSYDLEFFNECVKQYLDVYFNNNSDAKAIRERLYSKEMQASFEYIWKLFSTPNADDLLSLFQNEELIKTIFTNNLDNINYLHNSLYSHKSSVELDEFITFDIPGDNIATASSLIYYKDLNTRSRLLNFINLIRKLAVVNFNNFETYFPTGISISTLNTILATINGLQQKAMNDSTKNRNSNQFIYGADQIQILISLYQSTVQKTNISNSGFTNSTKSIYAKNAVQSMDFFKLEQMSLGGMDAMHTKEQQAIISNTTTVDVSIELYVSKSTLEKISNKAEGVSKAIHGTVGIFKKLMSGYYVNSSNDNSIVIVGLKIIKDILDTGIISLFGPIGIIANVILSAIFPTVSDLSYVFQLDESNKWYRKGGNGFSMLFGLVNFNVGGIDTMKIDKPIPLYKNIDADQYYYNGKKYKEAQIDKLLSDQLYDIYKGKTKNSKFNQQFYHRTESSLNDPTQIKYFNSVEKATEYFIDQLTTNPSISNELIANVVKDYDGTLTSTNNDAIELAISKITSTSALRPTKFINLPHLVNGYVDLNKESTIQSFQLPVAWDQTTGLIVHANKANPHMINNPIYNYQSNTAPNFSAYEFTSEQLQTRFLNSFKVQSKQTLISELLYTNSFDQIANNVTSMILYKVIDPSIQQKFFSSQEAAFSYLKKIFNFKVVTKKLEQSTYYFESGIYNNIYEIKDHILNNIIPMTKQEVEEYMAALENGVNYA